METPDSLLIRQVLAGQPAAYGALVARYQHYVFTLVLRYVPLREQAEELAQDVFVKAYSCLKDFRAESKFSTWLYTIVHTTCLSYLRKKPSSMVAVEEDRLVALVDRGGHDTTGQVVEQRSRKAMLEAAIGRMSASDAELLTLFYQGEQSLEEIAHITGTASNTVKVKLHRARQRLRDILLQRFPEEVLNLNHA